MGSPAEGARDVRPFRPRAREPARQARAREEGKKGGIPGRIAALEARVAELETLLAALSLEADGRTLRFTGVNVQIVSGSGATDGPVNGLGNLIMGYNEDEATNGCGPSGCVNRPAVRTGRQRSQRGDRGGERRVPQRGERVQCLGERRRPQPRQWCRGLGGRRGRQRSERE
jgi:hypothetical protein